MKTENNIKFLLKVIKKNQFGIPLFHLIPCESAEELQQHKASLKILKISYEEFDLRGVKYEKVYC